MDRQLAFESDYEAVANIVARRDRLDQATEAMVADSEYTSVVHRLGCLRGISTLTAFGLAVEIGDWDRFTGSSIGAFVGLTPCESSSGASRSLGSITKTGNTHARRLLVEAAWHHRRRNRAGLAVLTDLKNRGVHDVSFVVCDGLKGLPDVVNNVWRQAVAQSC